MRTSCTPLLQWGAGQVAVVMDPTREGTGAKSDKRGRAVTANEDGPASSDRHKIECDSEHTVIMGEVSGWEPRLSLDASASEGEEATSRLCGACGRPRRVCLCAWLPSAPLPMSGTVIILQHPHEAKRPFATVPLIKRCLSRCHVLVHRSFPLHRFPLLADVIQHAKSGLTKLLLLFPGQDSIPCSEAASLLAKSAIASPDCGAPLSAFGPYVLLVVDGTWRQAKEMTERLMEAGHVGALALRVRVGEGSGGMHMGGKREEGGGDSILGVGDGRGRKGIGGDDGSNGAAVGTGSISKQPHCLDLHGSALRLLAEPGDGLMMTCDAVARAVGVLEEDSNLQNALLRPLSAMVAQQAAFDEALRARTMGDGTERASMGRAPRHLRRVAVGSGT